MWRGAARQFFSGNWSSPEGSGFGRRLECRPLRCLTRADGQRLVCRVRPWHVSSHARTPHGPRSGRIQETGDPTIRIRQSSNTCLFITLVDFDTVTFGFFVTDSVGRVMADFNLNSALEAISFRGFVGNGIHPSGKGAAREPTRKIFLKLGLCKCVFNHRLLNNFDSRIKLYPCQTSRPS